MKNLIKTLLISLVLTLASGKAVAMNNEEKDTYCNLTVHSFWHLDELRGTVDDDGIAQYLIDNHVTEVIRVDSDYIIELTRTIYKANPELHQDMNVERSRRLVRKACMSIID